MRKSRIGSLLVMGLLVGMEGLGMAFDAPRSIASISVGIPVSDVADKVDLGSAVPLGGADFLMRAPLKPVSGFESGYVVYGNCKEKGRIVRIKLKYQEDDVAFYERVLAALKKRYGKPSEWRGNPFGTLKIWKWSLKDAVGHSISIQLQHYDGDDDAFTPGNSIKLTHSTYLADEKACYEARKKIGRGEPPAASPRIPTDFEVYLPH